MTPTAADWLLEQLAEEGVEIIFGNPGSTELPLIDALSRQSRIRYVLGLHEASVMGMADGYAQQGRRLGVVNVHVQPGLANAMAGILNASRARVPLLVTVGQQVTALKDQAPFLGGELVAMAEPVAPRCEEVTHVDDLPGTLARAVFLAGEHPRGPYVLSLPMDVLVAAAPDHTAGIAAARGELDREATATAARLLGAALRPAIVAGDGVVHERASDRVIDLACRIGAPIYGEPFAARVPVPTGHELWAGALPGFANEIRARLADHDVVLAIGMPVFRLFGDSDGPPLAAGTALLHLDVDPDEVGRNVTPVVGIVAPVAEGLDAIRGHVANPSSVSSVGRAENVAIHIKRTRSEQRAQMEELAQETVITPATLCRAIAAAVEPEDLIVDEALTSGRWLRTALIDRNTPDNWLAHRGSALGWGLPAAVGAKLADRGRRVMCVHGDGSFLFGVHALWTAAREGAGLAVIVADNGGYEILRAGLEGMTGVPDGPWPGLALDAPRVDLVAIAKGFGADAWRIESPDELDRSLAELWARSERGPAVLVVPVTGCTPAVGYPIRSV